MSNALEIDRGVDAEVQPYGLGISPKRPVSRFRNHRSFLISDNGRL